MFELSTKDMMLPYDGLITRLIHEHDIVIPPYEETLKLNRFNVINRNLLRRLRCIIRNRIWTRLSRRIEPPPLEPELEPETPVYRESHSPPTNSLEVAPPTEQAPSSSADPIVTQLDRIELRQDQILTEM